MKIIAYKTTDLGFHYFLVLVITAIVKFILFQIEQYLYAPIGVIVIILSTVIFIHYVKVPKAAVRLKNNQLVLHNNITLNPEDITDSSYRKSRTKLGYHRWGTLIIYTNLDIYKYIEDCEHACKDITRFMYKGQIEEE